MGLCLEVDSEPLVLSKRQWKPVTAWPSAGKSKQLNVQVPSPSRLHSSAYIVSAFYLGP
jgi:hypothetical protein